MGMIRDRSALSSLLSACRVCTSRRVVGAGTGAVLSARRAVGAEGAGRRRHGRGEARARRLRSPRRARRTGRKRLLDAGKDLRLAARADSQESRRAPTASSFATATSSPSSAIPMRRIRPTRSPRACSRPSPASPCAKGSSRISTRRSARRSRTAATTRRRTRRSRGGTTCSRRASGKARCGARSTTSSAPSAFGDGERKPRTLQAPGIVLRVQRRPHQSLLALAAATVQEAGARRVPRRGDERHRRVEHVAVDSLQEQLCRRRRQEGGVGERRHALGRRRLDQRHGTWRGSAISGCATAAGAPSRSSRPHTSRQALTASAHGPDYGFLWWLNTTWRREDAADQLVPGAGRGQQHDLRLARSRPGDRVALAWRRQGGIFPPGHRVDPDADDCRRTLNRLLAQVAPGIGWAGSG